MKKLLMYISISIFIVSCTNSEIEYSDYTYQTVYFPVQYPVRTLVLGESRYDNAIDLEHAFTIAVNVGGIYNNTKDRIVYVKYAPELVNAAVLTTTATPADIIEVLPPSYYTPDLSKIDKIVIPAGSFDGRIKIQLNDNFFKDSKSVNVKYVVPLVILPATEDSVLSGRPVAGLTNPNRLITSNWVSGFAPMDYTLYGIKYANKYHGNYFHYGIDSLFNAAKVLVGSPKRYSTKFVEDNIITKVTTASLTESTINRLGGTNVGDKYKILLKINDDKTVSLSSVAGGVVVSGKGVFKEPKDGIVWGGKGNSTIILNYSYIDTDGTHRCKDTLVYRTNAITYEDFKIKQ